MQKNKTKIPVLLLGKLKIKLYGLFCCTEFILITQVISKTLTKL